MAMDRLRRVSNIWNWLPAFRVVAEYESIHQAAAVLNVSASALSRTVRLLEDGIGETLFVRSATGLTLTAFGTELLTGTRDAMRRVDDVVAVQEKTGSSEQTFAAAADGPVLARLLDRALCAVVGDFERVRYRTTAVDEESVVAELLRGNLDLALVEGGAAFEVPDAVSCERIGDLELAVLAPPAHPLAAGDLSAIGDALATAKLITLASGTLHEGAIRPVATVASLESAESLAERGGFLALLPPALASPSFRYVAPSSARVRVAAVSRRPLEKDAPPLVQAILRAIRALVVTPRP